MSDYVVSARKYRPDSFETLVGQDNIAKTLKNSIKRGQLAHAYLFCGPRGVGKTSSARIFAKAINCSNPSPDMDPCGQCESCQSFAQGRSYCIHELDAASNNGVEDIKSLMEMVQIPPQVGKYSVYIIDEVHMLSQQAFNAFLKTLEEPPAHAIFILCTTEKHKIIPTILSRCQTYDFCRISVPDIVMNLRGIATKENIQIGDESLHVIARKADGAMRDALTIFDQTIAFCGTEVNHQDLLRNLNVLDYEYSFKLIDAALNGDYATVLLIINEVLAKGFNALHFVVSVGEHLRDLLVSRTAGLEALLDYPSTLKDRYFEQSKRCSVEFLYSALNCISACESGFKTSANQRLHVEFNLMKLCFLNANPAAPRPVSPSAATTLQTPVTTQSPVRQSAQQQPPSSQSGATDATQLASTQKEEVAASQASAPRRRGGGGMKISELSSSTVDSQAANVLNEDSSKVPTQTEVEKAWKAIIQMCESSAVSSRLASIFKHAPYEIAVEQTQSILTIKVDNESTRDWLVEKFVTRMESKMRTDLGSSKLLFKVDVLPVKEQAPIVYLDQDKAKQIIKDNPEVGIFVKDFELDA